MVEPTLRQTNKNWAKIWGQFLRNRRFCTFPLSKRAFPCIVGLWGSFVRWPSRPITPRNGSPKGSKTISSRIDPDDPGPYFILSGGTQLEIQGTLAYQACDDKICYLPEQLPIKFEIAIEEQDEERVPR